MAKVVATSLNRQFGYCTLVAAMFTGIVQGLGLIRSLRPSVLTIEPPLSPSSGMDDHWALGHIDVQGRVQALYQEGSGWTLIVDFSTQYRRFVAEKGSGAVEDISLTPYDLDSGSFRYAIKPDTYKSPVLKDRQCGYSVNLEFDIQAEYVERMIRFVHSD